MGKYNAALRPSIVSLYNLQDQNLSFQIHRLKTQFVGWARLPSGSDDREGLGILILRGVVFCCRLLAIISQMSIKRDRAARHISLYEGFRDSRHYITKTLERYIQIGSHFAAGSYIIVRIIVTRGKITPMSPIDYYERAIKRFTLLRRIPNLPRYKKKAQKSGNRHPSGEKAAEQKRNASIYRPY